jgi:hypothetical protein
MYKNIIIALLLAIVAIYFWGDSPAQECPVEKKTPRWEDNCIIQKSGDSEIKTCG